MNDFQKHFPFQLNNGQINACNKLFDFVNGNGHQVFILSGFAGTGKTTILKGILAYLNENDKKFALWASTGRAAMVLGKITERKTSTIHSAIYMVDENSSKLDDEHKTLSFKLKQNLDHEDMIYFIDEASMIADKSETNPFLLFEDGRLLEHVFKYFGDRKVVFIGDAAQLPPVNCSFSAALDGAYIQKNYQKKCQTALLSQVMRQQLESGILWNATEIRNQYSEISPPPVRIKTTGYDDLIVKKNIWSAIDDFVLYMKRNGPGKSVFISFTNGGVNYLNSQIRNNYYGYKDPPLQKGDFLMVVQNNYLYELVNGHHIRLVDFEETPIRQHSLHFYKAKIEIPETGKKKDVYLIKELLFRKSPLLTQQEENDLMKNFVIRMKQNGIRPKTEEFFRKFVKDPYLNALRVKFGYAVTCHKAQGGEWSRVYLNIEPALENIPRSNFYRWLYTAITRASKELVIPQNQYLY